MVNTLHTAMTTKETDYLCRRRITIDHLTLDITAIVRVEDRSGVHAPNSFVQPIIGLQVSIGHRITSFVGSNESGRQTA